MPDSILVSIKKMLGIVDDYTVFDADILMHINSVFFMLQQLGVGPAGGFRISDASATWSDYMPEDSPNIESVKSYIYLRVRLLFDPPLNSAVIESVNRQITELEWRLNVAVETPSISE